jgi:hypothetical protein
MFMNQDKPLLERLGDDRCQHLRWKSLFIDTTWDPTVPHGNDGDLWCSRTMINIGPDNKVVDQYECNESRKCYEAI